MLDLIKDLHVPIENKETTKEGINNEMPSNGKEWDTTNLFEDLMNEVCNELYPGCLEFFSNFLINLMNIKFSTSQVTNHLTCCLGVNSFILLVV